jgi:hypothetical protein
MGNPLVNVAPSGVMLSGATEAGISATQAASAAASAPALLGVLSMAGDVTSIAFAEALRATGAAYVGSMMEHSGQRGLFAGVQGLMGTTFEATEAIRAVTANIATAI